MSPEKFLRRRLLAHPNGRVGSCCATAGLLPSLPLTTSARSRHRSTALTSWQRVGLCAYGACKAGRRGLGRGCRSSRRRNQRRTCCPEHAGAGSCARSGAFRSGGGGAGSDVAVLGERAQRGLARHHRGRCLPPVHCHANGMFGWRRIGWATRRHPCVRCLTADRHQRSAHRQPDQPVLRQRLSRRPRSLLQRGAARQGGSALHGRLRAVPRRSDAARSVAGADRRVPHRSPAPASPQDGHAGHIDACPFWGSCCCPNGRQRLPEDNVRRFRNRRRGSLEAWRGFGPAAVDALGDAEAPRGAIEEACPGGARNAPSDR